MSRKTLVFICIIVLIFVGEAIYIEQTTQPGEMYATLFCGDGEVKKFHANYINQELLQSSAQDNNLGDWCWGIAMIRAEYLYYPAFLKKAALGVDMVNFVDLLGKPQLYFIK